MPSGQTAPLCPATGPMTRLPRNVIVQTLNNNKNQADVEKLTFHEQHFYYIATSDGHKIATKYRIWSTILTGRPETMPPGIAHNFAANVLHIP